MADLESDHLISGFYCSKSLRPIAKQKFPHLVGSKWTAKQKTLGWRHFRVVNRKNQDSCVFAELVATCDPEVRMWINAKALKNRQLWSAGWKTLAEIEQPEPEDNFL